MALVFVPLPRAALAQELTPQEVVDKARQTYQSLRTLQAEGFVNDEIVSGGKLKRVEKSFKIKLGRPNLYLLEWYEDLPEGFTKTVIWNSGSSANYFSEKGDVRRSKDSDQDMFFDVAVESSGLTRSVPALFFRIQDFLAGMTDLKLEESEFVRGEECYVLTGKSDLSANHKLWVSKARFVIVKNEFVYDESGLGAMDTFSADKEIEKALKRPADKKRLERERAVMAKMSPGLDQFITPGVPGGKRAETYYDVILDAPLENKEFEFQMPLNTKFKKFFLKRD